MPVQRIDLIACGKESLNLLFWNVNFRYICRLMLVIMDSMKQSAYSHVARTACPRIICLIYRHKFLPTLHLDPRLFRELNNSNSFRVHS
jgi:hypothetical protein